MAYQTVKDGIVDLLETLGYKQAEQAFDVDAMGENEYGNKFIVNTLEGENGEESEGIIGKYDDFQTWTVTIAFKKSARSEVKNLDDMHKDRELILRDLDDPANTQSFVDIMRYESWSVEDIDSYFILRINFRVKDRVTY